MDFIKASRVIRIILWAVALIALAWAVIERVWF